MTPAADAAPVFEVRGVHFSYGRQPVLEGIDLAVAPRDYLAILGPNGGGKTTLLKVILGLVEPQRGEVVSHLAHGRGRLGYVPQFSTFERGIPLRVRDVALMGRIGRRGLGRRFAREDRERASEALAAVRLEDHADAMADELSGGQVQRLLLARALVGEPEMMLLDEPMASLDAESRGLVRDLLLELNRTMPIVVVTHDPAAVAPDIRHIACLNRRLTFHGEGELGAEVLEETYGCPVELLTHGVPHRVLAEHRHPHPPSGDAP